MSVSRYIISKIIDGQLDDSLNKIYRDVDKQKQRYIELIERYCRYFKQADDIRLFSSPGRTEICGNHTDHQQGNVLAASINLDIISAASKINEDMIILKSDEYDENIISLDNLNVITSEYGTSNALVRGICARFVELGYKIGGFRSYTDTNVLGGSGLSSSASFEILICTILNHLYNDGKISPIELAKISQYSENIFFKKPSGLMDQMACSVGGLIHIDFKDNSNPIVEKINFDLYKHGYNLCIINTGGSHANLTDEYSYIPSEMKQIASYFNKNVLSEVDEEDFYKNIAHLRSKFGDRPILRAIHFFNDNKLVSKQILAIRAGNIDKFLNLIIQSGKSSYMYLQNVYSINNYNEQGLSLALSISEKLLSGSGAYRVHGGGFAGTIQCFVETNFVNSFKTEIENIFGEGSCLVLYIRNVGGIEIE